MQEPKMQRKSERSLLEVLPLAVLHRHKLPVLKTCFSAEGKLLISVDQEETYVWTRTTFGVYELTSRLATASSQVMISPEGEYIASVNERKSVRRSIRLWSSNGTHMADFSVHGEESSAVFAPDTSFIVIADGSGRIDLWNIATLEHLCEFEVPVDGTNGEKRIRNLAIAPGSTRLAFALNSKQGSVHVCDLEQRTPNTLDWKISSVTSLLPSVLYMKARVTGIAFSPDWRFLAIASDIESKVWLFDAQSLAPIGSLDLIGADNFVEAIAISPDAHYLAAGSGEGTVRIWHLERNELILQFQAHTSEIGTIATVISSIDWSRDGHVIATSSTGVYQTIDPHRGTPIWGENDYTVKLWQCKWGKKGS